VLWVPSLIRTSTLNRGGRACSSLTRTPSPITVAKLQWVIVGVISTRTVRSGEDGEESGAMWISGRLTTEREASERGCSGSEMVDIRSAQMR